MNETCDTCGEPIEAADGIFWRHVDKSIDHAGPARPKDPKPRKRDKTMSEKLEPKRAILKGEGKQLIVDAIERNVGCLLEDEIDGLTANDVAAAMDKLGDEWAEKNSESKERGERIAELERRPDPESEIWYCKRIVELEAEVEKCQGIEAKQVAEFTEDQATITPELRDAIEGNKGQGRIMKMSDVSDSIAGKEFLVECEPGEQPRIIAESEKIKPMPPLESFPPKCSTCGKPVSVQQYEVQLATARFSVATAHRFNFLPTARDLW